MGPDQWDGGDEGEHGEQWGHHGVLQRDRYHRCERDGGERCADPNRRYRGQSNGFGGLRLHDVRSWWRGLQSRWRCRRERANPHLLGDSHPIEQRWQCVLGGWDHAGHGGFLYVSRHPRHAVQTDGQRERSHGLSVQCLRLGWYGQWWGQYDQPVYLAHRDGG